jgi:Transposase, Mutator family
MSLDTESWMNVRRFRTLHAAGATYAEIGRECGCDWRTVRKYLAEDAPSVPPAAPPRAGTQPRVITPFVGVVETWLPADITLKATDIHERLVAEHGFTGNYQRVKVHLADARPRIAAELAEQDDNPLTGLNRRFRSTPHLPRPLRRSAWPEFIPFLDYDVEIRRVICSTNAIESPNARYRRAVRARGHFPTELAALKCLYLVPDP